MGDKMWEFIIPLILTVIAPETLTPSSVYGLANTAACVLFATSLGRQIDIRGRLTIVQLGIFVQQMSIAFSGGFLYFLIYFAEFNKEWRSNIFHDWISTLLFVGLLLTGSFGSLSTTIMDIAIGRDWIPTIIKDEHQLTLINTRMSQIDLVSEVGGPFIAGALLLIPGVNSVWALVAIAGFNYLTFWPEYALLRTVYGREQILREPKVIAIENDDEKPKRKCNFFWQNWNPIANIILGWRSYYSQPIFLVSLSFAFLWLTMLSPHGLVLTSYLKASGYAEWELAIFRGVSALVGVMATFAFPYISAKFGMQKTATLYIWEESIFVLLAMSVFTILEYGTHFLDSTSRGALRIVFLALIALSRCGLYGFEVGEIQILQKGIPEKIRGEVNSVETSLTHLASLFVYIGGIVADKPENFIYLVWGSGFFILLGSLVYSIWCFRYTIENELHTHFENDFHHNKHIELHQEEDMEELKTHGKHAHFHFHYRYLDNSDEEEPLLDSKPSSYS